jgi:hypothetical protein
MDAQAIAADLARAGRDDEAHSVNVALLEALSSVTGESASP